MNKKVKHLGYLVDTARNAVPTVDTLKKLMARLASFGYDRLYLYTEDTMEIEGEPFFGHLRGRYSFDEMREIDRYAADLGIEVIPCIQTLAHLNCMFKWPEYASCNDTTDILLIDDERTYKLIENVFATLKKCFRTNHVHIGMDEAYLVGRGKYMDQHGYVNRFELLKHHIELVMNIADKYGFTTEIWSDMYFREAFDGGYHSATKKLSDEICAQIPPNVGFVYWDYWNRDENVINNMFENHIKTGNEVIFAGGAWKWSGWSPSNRLALVVGRKMLDACTRYGVDNIVLTAWSDDGAEASIFSTLPSIVLYSQYAHGLPTDDESISNIIEEQIGITLDEYCRCDLDFFAKSGVEESYIFGTLAKVLLYNDPLSPFYDGVLKKYDITSTILECKSALEGIAAKCKGEESRMIAILIRLCEILSVKWDLGLRIRGAYQNNDQTTIRRIADEDIPKLVKWLDEFNLAFYKAWMHENKTNGYQTHDLRLGGLSSRLGTVRRLLTSYLDCEISEIHELAEELLDFDENTSFDMILWTNWKRIHSIYAI